MRQVSSKYEKKKYEGNIQNMTRIEMLGRKERDMTKIGE